MNIDTLGRVHAQEAHEAVATADMPPIAEVAARRTRRFVAGIAWTAAAATAVVATVLLVGPGSDVTPTTLPPTGATTTIPQAQAFDPVLQTDPLVLRADLGPAPTFDTAGLGIEQPIIPFESLNSLGQKVFTDDGDLIIDERVAVGYLPGSSERWGVMVASGTINNPMQAGYGEDGQCLWVSDEVGGGSGECHMIVPDTELRPFAMGIRNVGWVGWSLLPADASVVVLTVEGEDRYWQRPRGGIAFFAPKPTPAELVELRVLNADGVEIARGDRRQPNEPTGPTVEPIFGYGDFSDIAYTDLDWTEVVASIVACVNDQGFEITQSALGDGIGFGSVPPDQMRAEQFAEAQCRAGLRLPEPPYEPYPSPPPPILGYGDYTDVAYEDVDWLEVTALIVACVQDQGFFATLTPAGDRISYASVPEGGQRRAAESTAGDCRAGLNLPEPPG